MSDEKRFFRQIDAGTVINIFLLLAMIAGYIAYPAKWNQAVADIADIKPRLEANEQKLAVINAQYEDIREELRAINRKLGR